MGKELVTVCIFCFLCATHSHCSTHHGTNNSGLPEPIGPYNDTSGGKSLQLLLIPSQKLKDPGNGPISAMEDDHMKFVFEKYGDGDTLKRDGFEKLLNTLGISITIVEEMTAISNKTNDDNKLNGSKFNSLCENLSESGNEISNLQYVELCPKILHHIVPKLGIGCSNETLQLHHDHENEPTDNSASSLAVWVYASISVILISLCGLLAVAVIPLMQMSLYHGLLQFLVALAVGTLCGDALLHLLPHAMIAAHEHSVDNEHHHHHPSSVNDVDQHSVNLFRGLVAALSIVFFYFAEKCLSLVTEWRKKSQRKNERNMKVRVMRDDHVGNEESRVGEKLCKHKYSSYPYCYGEITSNSEINTVEPRKENGGAALHTEPNTDPKEDKMGLEKLIDGPKVAQSNYTTIILREHENMHHGHAHTHGHVHSAPASLGSVAWMVVMGDGIHNLTDGLAIGAAFAANIGGGVSTAVAVFCHELPHEIGDFAVLLKAGMSAKQAVFYNLLSSLLCFIGMSIGIILGHNDHVKLWVFSAAAGMFLYIALVDMIPELTSNHSKEGGSLCQCLLQFLGFTSGIGIMLLIALYENDLMTSFQNKF